MSMTRQEQLDAVVRNYGEWREGYCAYIDATGFVNFTNSTKKIPYFCFTRAEVEARKSELQNKPSWDDAPEGAKILVQGDYGLWTFGSYRGANIDERNSDWSGMGHGKWFISNQKHGEVIGDWRDTLEKRPATEVTPEEEEAFNMLEARNNDSGSTADDDIKWNGEGLPVEGCTAQTSGGECTVLAVDESRDQAAVRWLNNGELAIVKISVIKPIKSDREKWIDMVEQKTGLYVARSTLEAIYDAGLAKIPE